MFGRSDKFDQRFEGLKERAEVLLKEHPEQAGEISASHDLIHELQVYQAELEIQNEELRESQRQLLISRDRFAYLYHEAPVGYLSLDHGGVIREANTRIAVMLGLQRSDLIGKPLQNYIYSGDRAIYMGRFRAFHNTPDGKEMELRMERADHTVIHTLIEGRSSSVAQSEPHEEALILLAISDISDKEAAEAGLRLSDKVIQTAHEAVIITDAKGSVISVNPAFEQATGYSKAEVVGRNPRLLQSGRQSAGFYQKMWHTIIHSGYWSGTVWNRRKDGTEYAEHLSISAIRDGYKEITHFVGVFTDITEKLELEERLRQAQKMEAIGTLVGGIAHDFNNILAGIIGNVYLARKISEDRPNTVDKLDQIDHLSHHAAELISHMLTFARKDIVRLKELSLNQLIGQFIKGVGSITLTENVDLDVELADEELVVMADATKIQQMLLNLLTNARDAVEREVHPKVSIKLARFIADDAFLLKHGGNKGAEFARIQLADNGYGIDEDGKTRMFEPFYTTKEVGKGTGLGLSMVYGVVESLGGSIEVESAPGQGAIFTICLPLIQDREPVNEVVTARAEVVRSGGKDGRSLILLADDDEVLRHVTMEALKDAGYQVLAASNGSQLLDLFMEAHEDVALVMLDMLMPEMSGVSVAKQIHQLAPDTPIIFMTGYDKEAFSNLNDEVQHAHLFCKPFSLDHLKQTIGELLENGSNPTR